MHWMWELNVVTLPYSPYSTLKRSVQKGSVRVQRLRSRGLVREWKGREEVWGHLLWPRQRINKQTGCQAIRTHSEQTGRLTYLPHIYGTDSRSTQGRQGRWRNNTWVLSMRKICPITFMSLHYWPKWMTSCLKVEDRYHTSEVIKPAENRSLFYREPYALTSYKRSIRYHSSLMVSLANDSSETYTCLLSIICGSRALVSNHVHHKVWSCRAGSEASPAPLHRTAPGTFH